MQSSHTVEEEKKEVRKQNVVGAGGVKGGYDGME